MDAELKNTDCPEPGDPDLAELGMAHAGCAMCLGSETSYYVDAVDIYHEAKVLADCIQHFVEDNTVGVDFANELEATAAGLREWIYETAADEAERAAEEAAWKGGCAY